MTVRVVATASGRVSFGGSGYAPEDEVRQEDGGPVDGPLRLERALAVADLANNATVLERDGRWIVQGDPTEAALLVAARKAGLGAEALAERLPRVGEVPFSSERKLMSTVHRDHESQDRLILFTKGAPDVLRARSSDGAVALPLLATQILWINLVTDGAPALALGVDPMDEGLMHRLPRPPGEGTITARMWRGFVFVGIVMAAGTLFVLDASLPGGFVEGTGNLRYAQTMAFTTLMLFQLFNVLNARSDEQSAFVHLFTNRWLWGSLGLSLVLQFLVLYVPALQRAFGTVPLTAGDWLRCIAAASTVLWLREAGKLVTRLRDRRAGITV